MGAISNMKPSMLEALNKYNGALPQTLAPKLFMLILTIFIHETAPLGQVGQVFLNYIF